MIAGSLGALGNRFLSSNPMVDNSVAIWFMDNDPELNIYEKYNKDFGEKDWSILLVETDSIYNPIFLRDLDQLTRRIEKLAHVVKVISITNARDNTTTADGELEYIQVYPKTEGSRLINPVEIETFRKKLSQNPIFENSIYRKNDTQHTLILFQNDNFIHSVEPYRIRLVDSIYKIAQEYQTIKTYSLAGTTVINAELNRSSQKDAMVFYILVSLFVLCTTYLLFRNFKDVLVLCSVLVCSAVVPMAFIALYKIPYNMVTIMLPCIVVVLSICDVTHVISAYHVARRYRSANDAMTEVIGKIWFPCLWTSLITCIGFFSLLSSTVYPIWQLGVFCAIGVFVAWLATMTLVPTLLVLLWPQQKSTSNEHNDGSKEVGFYSKRLIPLLSGKYKWLCIGAGLIMLFPMVGIKYLAVDTNYTKFFSDKTDVSRAYADLDRLGFGQNPISIVLRYPEGKSVVSETYFKKLMQFEEAIKKDTTIIKLLSVTELIGRIDQAFNGENAGAVLLSDYSQDKVSQLLLLGELAGNDDVKDFLSADKRILQMIAMTPYMSSQRLALFKKKIYESGEKILPPDVTLEITATTALWANMDKEISETGINSIFIMTLIFVVLMPIIFKSIKFGIIGMLINSLPVGITFGLMGLLDIKVNVATALIGSVAIGATIDSTFFFINSVRQGLVDGLHVDEAVNNAMAIIGDGIIMTSLIVAGGFLCMATSDFLPTAYFGKMVAMSMIISLFFDIIMSPIILKFFITQKMLSRIQLSTGENMIKQILSAILLVNLFIVPASAEEQMRKGRIIFEIVASRDAGYGDLKANLTMLLEEKSKPSVTRLMDMAMLEVKGDGARLMVTFNNPADVRDAKVLTHTHPIENDQQWIYLPAFKRTKQISDSNKTNSFMGSEFTYEDISAISINVPKFDYNYLKTETGTTPYFVVERIPKYNNTGYKRQIVWINPNYVIEKVEYYDHDDKLQKTLSLSGYQKYLDKFWRAREMVMVNHQNGKTTTLTWADYELRNGFDQNDFDLSILKK